MAGESRERFSRKALLAFASNYRSVSEALMELVDNPFDYRGNRHLVIDVVFDLDNNLIIVRDQHGEGMDKNALDAWLHWGDGLDHDVADIGQFRVGGKLAALFLADGIQIVCRRAGDNAIWNFTDPSWGLREDFLETTISRISRVSRDAWIGQLPDDRVGFVQVSLTGLRGRRADITTLENRLADTYKTLINRGKCTIRVDGQTVFPNDVPWTDDVATREIPLTEVADKVFVQGQVGALDRARLQKRIGVHTEAGVRTEFNGRKISIGEDFGINLAGRGSTLRLYGEIDITGGGLLPSQNKTSWDHDSLGWSAVHRLVQPIVQAVVRDLNRVSREAAKTTAERRRTQEINRRRWKLNYVKRRIAHALQLLRDDDRVREPGEEDHVASITRYADDMPQIILRGEGIEEPRSTWQARRGGELQIIVNSDYPLCVDMKASDGYLFETVLMHLIADSSHEISAQTAHQLLDELHWLDAENGLPETYSGST